MDTPDKCTPVSPTCNKTLPESGSDDFKTNTDDFYGFQPEPDPTDVTQNISRVSHTACQNERRTSTSICGGVSGRFVNGDAHCEGYKVRICTTLMVDRMILIIYQMERNRRSGRTTEKKVQHCVKNLCEESSIFHAKAAGNGKSNGHWSSSMTYCQYFRFFQNSNYSYLLNKIKYVRSLSISSKKAMLFSMLTFEGYFILNSKTVCYAFL